MSGRTSQDHVRELLAAWRRGDRAARDRLFEILYAELTQAAAGMLRGERHVSLSVGDLVHETILKLIALDRIDWQDRAHFMALTSVMMRRALVEHVRAKRRAKRDHQKVELVTNIPDAVNADLEDINDALDQLSRIDSERADIVEMRYFGGMEIADIAVVLNLSESTVKRRWQAARLWLYEALAPQHG
ncbi:MAG: sigma-70 family RNA polymerase sigma factor [Phenylobacterium sp.]|uniref:ECF-type sigma factor n=1 Tax=Phenylobacterium sp. TaxID=1871053 RepID=UPI001A391F96|nr:ECF-type sigma factor [Phenylobacterium sp.]MBL8772349.1 sigma-70 family RNA polymerase sigma factor [Phenylobacterium sp.]